MVSKQKILIVDDDNNIAELIALYLTKECFETKIVNDGEEALKKFASFHPDLIILDLMLPGIDGYQVCRELRQLHLVEPRGGAGLALLQRLEDSGQAGLAAVDAVEGLVAEGGLGDGDVRVLALDGSELGADEAAAGEDHVAGDHGHVGVARCVEGGVDAVQGAAGIADVCHQADAPAVDPVVEKAQVLGLVGGDDELVCQGEQAVDTPQQQGLTQEGHRRLGPSHAAGLPACLDYDGEISALAQIIPPSSETLAGKYNPKVRRRGRRQRFVPLRQAPATLGQRRAAPLVCSGTREGGQGVFCLPQDGTASGQRGGQVDEALVGAAAPVRAVRGERLDIRAVDEHVAQGHELPRAAGGVLGDELLEGVAAVGPQAHARCLHQTGKGQQLLCLAEGLAARKRHALVER